MLRFVVESDSFDRCATNRRSDDRLHGTLRVPTQRKENREARSHAGSSMHATTQRQTKQTHNTRSDERTKDTQTRDQSDRCKHANTRPIISLQTCTCEDTEDTNEPKNREDVKDTQTTIHATTHMHTQQRHRRSRRHNTQTGKRNYPPHPPPTHAKSCVITRNPDPSQRQHAYANETTHDRRCIGAYAPDPP